MEPRTGETGGRSYYRSACADLTGPRGSGIVGEYPRGSYIWGVGVSGFAVVCNSSLT